MFVAALKVSLIFFFPGVLIYTAWKRKLLLPECLLYGFNISLISAITVSLISKLFLGEFSNHIFYIYFISIMSAFFVVLLLRKPRGIRIGVPLFSSITFLIFLVVIFGATYNIWRKPLKDCYEDRYYRQKIDTPVAVAPYFILTEDGFQDYYRGFKTICSEGKTRFTLHCSRDINLLWLLRAAPGSSITVETARSVFHYRIPLRDLGPHQAMYNKLIAYNYLLIPIYLKNVSGEASFTISCSHSIEVYDLSYRSPLSRRYVISSILNPMNVFDEFEAWLTALRLKRDLMIYFQPPLRYYSDLFAMFVNPHISSLYFLFFLELLLIFLLLCKYFNSDIKFFMPFFLIHILMLFKTGVAYQQDTLYTYFLIASFFALIAENRKIFFLNASLAVLVRYPGVLMAGLLLGGCFIYEKRNKLDTRWVRKSFFTAAAVLLGFVLFCFILIKLDSLKFKHVLSTINFEIIPEHYNKASIRDFRGVLYFFEKIIFFSGFLFLVNILFIFKELKNKKCFTILFTIIPYSIMLAFTIGRANRYIIPILYFSIICFYFWIKDDYRLKKHQKLIFSLIFLTSAIISIQMLYEFLQSQNPAVLSWLK